MVVESKIGRNSRHADERGNALDRLRHNRHLVDAAVQPAAPVFRAAVLRLYGGIRQFQLRLGLRRGGGRQLGDHGAAADGFSSGGLGLRGQLPFLCL